jgi:hypothetical protein
VAAGQGFDLGGVSPAGADEAPDAKPDPVVGDKVPMGQGSVTVSAVEDDVSAGRLFGAGKGFKYVAAEVKGCSGPAEKNITFEPAYFLLRLDDGTIRDPGVDAKKPSLNGGTVPPGKCLSGWVTFTVPEGALPTGVIYDGSVRTTWTVPLPKNAKQTTTTTMKPGATAGPAGEEDSAGEDDGDGGGDGADRSTTSSTKPRSTTTTSKSTATTSKSTATTAKPTPTTARGSTATTSKSTTTTGKSSGSTTTTAKPAGSTTTTAKPSGSTTTTSRASGSTATTGKSSASTSPSAAADSE